MSYTIKKTFNRLPVGINQAYPTNRSGRRFLSDEGKEWKKELGWAFKKGKPQKGEFGIEIYLTFGDKRRRDADSGLKLILDALTGVVYEDDNQVKEIYISREYGKKHKTEIEVYKFEN